MKTRSSYESIDKRWSRLWWMCSRTCSSSTTSGSSSSKSSLWSEATLSDLKTGRRKKFCINFTFEIQVRDIAAIYDSYNCGIIWKFGHCRPWPSKRQGFRSPASLNCSSYLIDKLSFPRYVGYGPTKNYAVRALRRKRCPVKCRPEAHKDWEYCWTYSTDLRLAFQKTTSRELCKEKINSEFRGRVGS